MRVSNQKASALARDLKSRLTLRGFVVTESKDGNGFPILSTDKLIAIAIVADSMISKDILGNDLLAYTPHTCTISYSATTPPALADLVAATLEVSKIGMRIALTETDAPSTVSIEFDSQWPGKGM